MDVQPPDDGPLAGDGANRLLAFLSRTLDQPDVSYAAPPERVMGGNETFIYGLRLRDAPAAYSAPLILRAYRAGYGRPHQARLEATVQNSIASLGYPAARVLIVAPGTEVLGTPFIVMERLPGSSVLQGIGGPDASGHMRFEQRGALLRSTRLLWQIPRLCAEAQLRLHALDPQPLLDAIEREGLPPETITLAGRLEWLRAYIDDNNLTGLREAHAWLIAQQREPERLAICHCDMQPINLLVTDGAITGVVDWSQVIVANPALDVAYTKVAMDTVPLNMPARLQWLARPIARIVSRSYLRTYTKERAVRPEALAYYGVLRALFALAGPAVRRATGQSEPDVWDNPQGVRNLVEFVRSATGLEVHMPEDTRTALD